MKTRSRQDKVTMKLKKKTSLSKTNCRDQECVK